MALCPQVWWYPQEARVHSVNVCVCVNKHSYTDTQINTDRGYTAVTQIGVPSMAWLVSPLQLCKMKVKYRHIAHLYTQIHSVCTHIRVLSLTCSCPCIPPTHSSCWHLGMKPVQLLVPQNRDLSAQTAAFRALYKHVPAEQAAHRDGPSCDSLGGDECLW